MGKAEQINSPGPDPIEVDRLARGHGVFISRMRPRDRLSPTRYKGVKRGEVLLAVQTLKKATAQALGSFLGLPPQTRADGVRYHLHSLVRMGILEREVSDRVTLYSVKG